MGELLHIMPRGDRWVVGGVSYGPGGLLLEAETAEHIVLRSIGHRWNSSGIRGMRIDCWAPAYLIVFRKIEPLEDGGWCCERLIQWKPSEAAAKRRKGGT